MAWLNNQWVIGIGTSIISGFLVFFFTRKFFTDKQNKEYDQKIRTANNEILYAVRPLIVEKTKPSKQVLDSVLYSTARKYGVELSDIYNVHSLSDDLTNEIMSNSFLSSDQKIELAELINNLRNDGTIEEGPKIKKIILHRENKTNSVNSSFMAFTLSTMTAMMTLIISVFSGLKDFKLFSNDIKFPEPLSIILVATVIPILALTMTTFLIYLREKEKSFEKNKIIDIVGTKQEHEDKKKPAHNKTN